MRILQDCREKEKGRPDRHKEAWSRQTVVGFQERGKNPAQFHVSDERLAAQMAGSTHSNQDNAESPRA